jgi:hypothetical protein
MFRIAVRAAAGLLDGVGASRLFMADALWEKVQILKVQPETGPMLSTDFASG